MKTISRMRQLIYANGYGGFSILDNIFGIYFIFFLLPPVETGMPELINNTAFWGITLIGLIIIFGRLIDSIADPLIAYWSDRNRSAMGRRRFFLLTGSLPFAVITVMLFTMPDSYPGTANAVYSAVVLGVYFFFYTYFMTPYLALIPEITHSHQNRISVTVTQAFFMLIGAAIVMMGVPAIWTSIGGITGEMSDSFRISIAIVAAIGFLSMMASGLAVKEDKNIQPAPAEITIFQSIKMTLTNRAFIIYLVPVITFWFSFHMIRSTIAYYPMVLLHKEIAFQTILMVLLFGGAAFFFIIISLFSKKISNKGFMLTGLISFGVLTSVTFFIDTMLHIKIALFGDISLALIAACLQMFLLGFPVAILLVIPNAIVADISEVDSYEKGAKREAMFFGTQGLFMKINYGIAAAIIAGLFAVFGKDVAEPLGVKLSGPAASIFAFAGFLIMLKYPQSYITEQLNRIREHK